MNSNITTFLEILFNKVENGIFYYQKNQNIMANTDAYKYELFILKQAQGKKLSPSQGY